MTLPSKISGQTQQASVPSASTPPGTSKLIKAWDAYGRGREVPLEEWRATVFPSELKQCWNNPEKLSWLISKALSAGLFADCLEPSRRLCCIDPQPRRGVTYLGATMVALKQFGEAEKVITQGIQQHGEDHFLRINLAKAYHGLGDLGLAESTLWRALELDSNSESDLTWYLAFQFKRGGAVARSEGIRRVNALPGNWRERLVPARLALKKRQLEQALADYREALTRAPRPVPRDLLMEAAGDLLKAGYILETVQLIEPHFDAWLHGISVGNILLKALADLGQLDGASRVLNRLLAFKRVEWKEFLNTWHREIGKMRLLIADEREGPTQIKALSFDGPIWWRTDSPAAKLFPAKPAGTIAIAFLGGTVETELDPKTARARIIEPKFRMGRAVPLFLAEQTWFSTEAEVRVLELRIVGMTPQFMAVNGAWSDEKAAEYARQGESKSDYVVSTFIRCASEPWKAELRLVRTIDARCLGTLSASFPPTRPEEGIHDLSRQLMALLRRQADVEGNVPPATYQVPPAPYFADYLIRLQQLLDIRSSATDGVPPVFFNSEREIIDGSLFLCVDCPQNIATRLVFAEDLRATKQTRPEVLAEYKEKIELLQNEKPLAEPAQAVVQRIFNEMFAA